MRMGTWTGVFAVAILLHAGCANSMLGRIGGVGKGNSSGASSYGIEMAKGRNHETAKNFAKARSAYLKLHAQHPTKLEPVHRLAVIADKQKKYDEAHEYYAKALTLAPEDAQLYSDFGFSCFSAGRLQDAEELLLHAVRLNPDLKVAHNNLGLVYGHTQRTDLALREFMQAGKPADAYYNLAFVHSSSGDYEQAKTCFRKALAFDPSFEKAQKALRSFATYELAGDEGLEEMELPTNGVHYVPFREGGDSEAADDGVQQASHNANQPASVPRAADGVQARFDRRAGSLLGRRAALNRRSMDQKNQSENQAAQQQF